MKPDIRIGIDACALRKKLTGIGRYSWEICLELDKLLPEAKFYLYSPDHLELELPSKRWKLRVGGSSLVRYLSSYAWLRWYISKMTAEDKIDIFWSPRTLLPNNTESVKTISTVHDLNFLLFPRSMPYITWFAQRLWYARDLHSADAVVANSCGTADRLRSLLNIKVDEIVKPGVSSHFFPRSRQTIRKKLNIFRIDRPYYLTVGTLEPRKNISRLVDAWLDLKNDNKLPNHLLVIVGLKGWRSSKLSKKLNLSHKSGVRTLGFVSDDDLGALYSGAQAFIMPSLYEGFGMPLQEARACGTRLVSTNTPELREAGGPHGIYVECNIEGLKNGIISASSHTVSKPDPIHQWSDSALVMADVIRRLSR